VADLIEQISEVRRLNNVNWMELLRIAFEADPDRTKAVLQRIEDCDGEVTRLMRELVET